MADPETPAKRPPTPITVLSGFLGAGKTTLLRRLLTGDHGLRLGVLVNDFGDINIDQALVADVAPDTIALQNGCVCCTIREDLLAAVEKLRDRPDPPEHVIIEASGVSDPASIAASFGLFSMARVDAIVSLVDAERFGKLDGPERRLAEQQLRSADLIVLNKLDLVSPSRVPELRRAVEAKVPKARVVETTQAQVPLELFFGRTMPRDDRVVDHDGHGLSAVGFANMTYRGDRPMSAQKLREVIENLPERIFRVKGIVYLGEQPKHRIFLQAVGQRSSIGRGPAWGEAIPKTELLVIGRREGWDPEALEAAFRGCELDALPKPPSRFSLVAVVATFVVAWIAMVQWCG